MVKAIPFKDFFALGYQPASFFEDLQICEYFFEYFSGQDCSRVVFFKGEPILFFPALIKDGEYSFAGLSIEPSFNTPDFRLRIQALEEVLAELFQNEDAKMNTKFSSEIAPLAMKWGCSIRSKLSAHIDLTQAEEEIRKGLRSSYKALINKGQRELQTQVDFGLEASLATMKAAQEFHFSVSGRRTRSDRTWEIQHELIVAKKAFHVRSSVDGVLAASSYVFTDGKDAYYGSGVYDRELMHQGRPLSHWNVYKAIMVAKELGVKRFILGEVGPDFTDKKNEDIAMFKRGFGGKIELESSLIISRAKARTAE